MSIIDKNTQPFDEQAALQAHIEDVLGVTAPSGTALNVLHRVVHTVFKPVVVGAEKIPERPCLFVGNHSLFALDGYLLGPIFFNDLGRFVRGLADRFLFASPKLGEFLKDYGCALGHPQVCSALMEAGQDIMVFPGGAHEAVKPASEIYQLQWRERYGFVRLAAQHGYTIVPFGTVGPDELYGHLLEGQDIPDSPLGTLLKRLGVLNENTRPDMLPPLPVGALGTLIPKPHRIYMGFGEPIDLSRYAGRTPTKRQQQKIRGEVAEQIEEQIAQMMVVRARNRGNEGLLRRLLTI
ncbi:acyltransferase family protein [Mangrovimicrobium sediminis]|uniref:Acyltransferase family protein n=1 Tax=Mangrovimicrobium sediminis TaxID=2562682 RepID=A0A4Z0M710_9GAMM|nr:lysophospholipid acyltransferase family protein [Haliea sp. SAOS-164]TGD75177.1 acyltransferase family protein [Haliea sp. SAOS-164]